jgi:hypothetical protein
MAGGSWPKHHRAVGSSNRSRAHSTTITLPPGASASRMRSSTWSRSATWCSDVQATTASIGTGGW